jgi:hypothetical protein
MPLSFTPLLLLKLLHVCDQWHSSRVFTPRTGWHCKLRPTTEGALSLPLAANFWSAVPASLRTECLDAVHELMRMQVMQIASSKEGALTNVQITVYGARLTMDSAVLGLASSGCGCCTVRVFMAGVLRSRTPLLVHAPARLKLLHTCDEWHSSRVFTPLTG